MPYWNTTGRSGRPFFIPDVRSHAATWQQFNRRTGSWPMLSIVTYCLRWTLMLTGVVVTIWYGNAKHDWTRTQGELAIVLIYVPFWFLWRLVERIAWNRNLRAAGRLRGARAFVSGR